MYSYAVKEIRRRKLRTTANVLGYIIAVAFLIIAVSLAQSYVVVANGTLEGIGTHFAAYIPASKVCPCQFGEVGPYFKDTYTPTFNTSLVSTVKDLSGVADAAPCLMFRLENETICGINPNALATRTTAVSPSEVVQGKGRYLQSTDTNEVMIDEVFASVSSLNVGDTFSAFNYNFTVVGIVNPSLHSKPAGIANIYATIETVQNITRHYSDLYGFAVKDINVVLVEIAAEGDPSQISTVQKLVLNTVESYGGHIGAVVGYQCGFIAREVVSVTESSAWAISAVLLICVMLFSLKTQFSSVSERTKEIGILKSLGWTDGDVTKQIFYESLLQGVAGGIIGVIIGSIAVLLIPQLLLEQNLQVLVAPTLVAFGLMAATIGGVIAGIIPAWRAARLEPADALRRF